MPTDIKHRDLHLFILKHWATLISNVYLPMKSAKLSWEVTNPRHLNKFNIKTKEPSYKWFTALTFLKFIVKHLMLTHTLRCCMEPSLHAAFELCDSKQTTRLSILFGDKHIMAGNKYVQPSHLDHYETQHSYLQGSRVLSLLYTTHSHYELCDTWQQ